MSVKKFKFVSPGIFVAEIDNSQLPEEPRGVGPVIVGRALKGPALMPVQVNSFSDFVETFGDPIFGGGSSDTWRAGPNVSGPSYATYAAQAYLKNKTPCVFVRLAGVEAETAANTYLGRAGWEASETDITSADSTGGAFGLFLVDSGSTPSALGTGSLAAVFYCKTGVVELSGTMADGSTIATGTAGLFQSTGDGHQFTAQVRDEDGITDKVVFNFNENSKLYARSVFNTNPTLLNETTNVAASRKSYFLGETFDRNIEDNCTPTNTTLGIILGLASGSVQQHIQDMQLAPPNTGWFISQDLGLASNYSALSMQKLFRFIGLDNGEWPQSNLKMSITDIKASPNEDAPFGTFDVQIRKIGDSDNNVQPVETFSNVNLNPNSSKYLARVIGDAYTQWDHSQKRYLAKGDYVNQSRYVRVEIDDQVANGVSDPKYLPFGVYGPSKYTGIQISSGTAITYDDDKFILGNASIPRSLASASFLINVGDLTGDLTCSFKFPEVPLRISSSSGVITNQKNAYFGATTNQTTSNRLQRDIIDMVRRKPDALDDNSIAGTAVLDYSWVFSLDDVKTGAAGTLGVYASGSRADGSSISATGSNDYTDTIDAGHNKFTTVFQGGFDGLDIREREPFRNTLLAGAGGNASIVSAYASIERAIDAVSDAEVVECNMMSIPGVTEPTLTSKLIDVCEARADALAIIDLENGYVPTTEGTSVEYGSVQSTISTLNQRNLNSSYGCAYYPWVQVVDTVTTGGSLWVPPSVVVLGTLASSEANSELWFAPAGFTRGGLTEGSAGLPVSNVRERLSSDDRDKLYTANVNPIAQFPAEGIVIFGQKTLQVTRSALDRVNVRRLLIYVKREISRIASTLLFDQNVKSTWNRFLGQANPFLGSVKTRLGLLDYKIILDETTTTPDLIDRNVMYAKIFLKPAKAIEFIALDFVITRSGASFDD